LIVIAEAKPFIVFAAVRTCLISKTTVSFAGTATVVAIETSSNNKEYVPAAEAVLTIRILFTKVVVLAGTV
jgi:hypothetical protein